MLFSSGIFWVFYAVVMLLIQLNYLLFKSIKVQNVILLVASYFFYAFWDWRFLGLILVVSIQTYLFGKLIDKHNVYRKFYLFTSVFINILVLGYFKYFNFFAGEFSEFIGLQETYTLENIILPVGISFYIFQSLTYVIDIYFRKMKSDDRLINYLTYIAFFPQLVAGPIERAAALLPQFNKIHSINLSNLYIGIKICIVGLFLKVFIADSVAAEVDYIFSNYNELNGGTLFFGAVYFSIQIYGDFCGYSLIAIGVAKVMGFELMRNFNTPYFSTSIQDFWRRWHISLSTFFRDYVYIPLGGNRVKNNYLRNRNILTTFILSGVWHGANWTFILWGAFHGALLILQNTLRVRVPNIIGWFVTMFAVHVLWVLFRTESISSFYEYMSIMVSNPGVPEKSRSTIVFIFYYLLTDLILFKYQEQGKTWFNNSILESLVLSIMLILVVGTIHKVNPNFIYFQF